MREITVDELRSNEQLLSSIVLSCKRELVKTERNLGWEDTECFPNYKDAKEYAFLLLHRWERKGKCVLTDEARSWIRMHIMVSMWELL